MEAIPRILRESSHEALQSSVEARCSMIGGISGKCLIGVGVGSTGAIGYSKIRTVCVWQCDDVVAAWVDIAWNWYGIGKSYLSWMINVEHVADVGP